MQSLIALLLLRLPMCMCFLGAIYLLAVGVTIGWGGWLIFAGILCSGGSYSYKTKDSGDNK